MTEHISTLDKALAFLAVHPELIYLISFMLLSYLVKQYFGAVLSKITRIRWQTVYTVLIIATLMAVPFIVWTETTWEQIVLMYAVGTSLHELILEKILKHLKK